MQLLVRKPFFRDLRTRHLVRWYTVQNLRRLARRAPENMVSLTRHQACRRETFGGYYDVPLLSADGGRLLAHATSVVGRNPRRGELAQTGYFDRTGDGRFTPVDETPLWCWQLGSRLRWWPDANSGIFAYNGIYNGICGTIFRSAAKGEVEHFVPHPTFDLDKSGRLGMAISFPRLAWARPGYGYLHEADAFKHEREPNADGAWRVDIETGKAELILSIAEAAQFRRTPEMEGAFHYFNGLSLNPSGTRFSLLHVWINDPNQPNRWGARAITSSVTGEHLFLLEAQGTPSHYAWLSDDKIVLTIVDARYVSEYVGYVDQQGPENSGDLSGLPDYDGHPSLSPQGEWLITDSYPNRYGDQVLGAYNIPQRRYAPLAHLRPRARYWGDVRCDLHPRWSSDGAEVIFDSAHAGGRAIYVARFPKEGIST